MKTISKKDFFFISLTLFSIFFGSGNLIFPPMLGYNAGTNVWITFIGFIITAVVLPILGVIVVAKANGIINLGNRVHPLFSKLFSIAMFLAIGPMLAIPRNASLAYDITFKNSFLPLPVYTVIFFAIAFWLSYSPTKLVSRIGKFLSPVLISLIFISFVTSLFANLPSYQPASSVYAQQPITQGILDGYNTLDVLASLNYGIVVLVWFKNRNLNEKTLVKTTAKAGVVAGSLLTVIYMILAHLGASVSQIFPNAETGADILKFTTSHLFGSFGVAIIGTIFTIACMCVCVGLLTSCSEFFKDLTPKVSYNTWLIILTLISFSLANFGLKQILVYSVPVLLFIYPAGIVLVLLGLLEKWIHHDKVIYQSTMFVTVLISLLSTIQLFPFFSTIFTKEHPLIQFMETVPLYKESMAWIIPFLVVLCVTYFVRWKKLKNVTQ